MWLPPVRRYLAAGRWVGCFIWCVAVLSALYLAALDWWQPREGVDVAPDWPLHLMREQQQQQQEQPRPHPQTRAQCGGGPRRPRQEHGSETKHLRSHEADGDETAAAVSGAVGGAVRGGSTTQADGEGPGRQGRVGRRRKGWR